MPNKILSQDVFYKKGERLSAKYKFTKKILKDSITSRIGFYKKMGATVKYESTTKNIGK